LLVGGVVVAVIAAGVGLAVALTRDDGKSTLRSSAPVTPKPNTKSTSAPSRPRPRPTQPVAQQPPASIAQPPVAPPVVVAPQAPPVAPTEPPATSPPVSPPSVLQWSATPAALTIPSGGHKTLTVHVVNPSGGTVTLGHPLSCPPTLRDAKGHVIGFGVCTEMAQLLAPHEQQTQHYVIAASADGAPLAPGVYTASVENLFDVKVTVTA
jgi:hypothetical protein